MKIFLILTCLCASATAHDWSWLEKDQPVAIPDFIGGPIALDVDHQGNIYIVDTENTTIHKMSPDGVVLFSFGRKGQGPGEFNYLLDIAVDPKKKRVWAIDAFSANLFCFDLEGTLLYQKSENWQTYSIAYRPDGHLVLGGTGENNLALYSDKGDFIKWFGHANKDTMHLLGDQLRRDPILDIGDKNATFVSYGRAPIVAAYGVDLKERWETERLWLGDEDPIPSKLDGMRLKSDIYHLATFMYNEVIYFATEEDKEGSLVAFHPETGKYLGAKKIDFRPRAVVSSKQGIYVMDTRNGFLHQFPTNPGNNIKSIRKAEGYNARYEVAENTRVIDVKAQSKSCDTSSPGCSCSSGRSGSCSAGCCGK